MLKPVEFNYFYRKFIIECQEKLRNMPFEKFISSEYGKDIHENMKINMLSIYDNVLWDICFDYISMDELDINLYPVDAFELIDMIFNSPSQAINRQSFMLSLQFILVDYLHALEIGYPILRSSKGNEEEHILEVLLNGGNEIVELEGINISEEEMAKLIVDIVKMIREKKQGPYYMTRIKKNPNYLDSKFF